MNARALTPATFADYRAIAKKRLPRQLFDFIDGGAYQEVTLRDNAADFDSLRIRQRVLRDVSRIDTKTSDSPSGDHVGMVSMAGWVVILVISPVRRLRIQRSKSSSASVL